MKRILVFLTALACSSCSSGPTYPEDEVDAGPEIDGGEVCFPLPTDSDDDTISDTHEGSPHRDSDDDGTPDYLDLDSDNDGILDADEAGDTDPCTEPRDSDGDDIADSRETDSDDNGIPDAEEADEEDLDDDGYKNYQDRDDDGDGIYDSEELGEDPANPLDSDADGTPDYQDSDSDNDGIGDLYEGKNDDDGDSVPAYLDDDSDGDGITDALEGDGDPGTPPPDADGDSTYDFLDVDSDNDGLSDNQEDTNLNGSVDPGESDPSDYDTDDDGYPDVVEWAAGSDPTDSSSGLDEDDFYFVLPYYDAEQEDELDFSTDIISADVFFEVDTTGSMSGTISTLQDTLQTVIVPGLSLEIANVALGAAYFKDFPVNSFGSSSDLPFKLTQRITTVIDDIQNGIDQFSASGGADGPESGMEALYQAVTGEGIAWTVDGGGSVPKFDAYDGYDPDAGHGLLGGAGFREGSLPIIVHATDIEFHDADDYIAEGITDAHSRDEAVSAAIALGARFIGITSSTTAKTQLQQIARDTGAVVSPEAWGAGETFCHTGEGGAPEPPDTTGLCPLVFDMGGGGSGVDDQVVDAIKALVTYGTIDISGVPVSDPLELPAVDTALFITAITPVPPAPDGSTIDGDIFRDVQPGVPVRFTVRARNTIVDSTREAQLFRVTIRVMGDEVTTLDERDVYVVVPGGGIDP